MMTFMSDTAVTHGHTPFGALWLLAPGNYGPCIALLFYVSARAFIETIYATNSAFLNPFTS